MRKIIITEIKKVEDIIFITLDINNCKGLKTFFNSDITIQELVKELKNQYEVTSVKIIL